MSDRRASLKSLPPATGEICDGPSGGLPWTFIPPPPYPHRKLVRSTARFFPPEQFYAADAPNCRVVSPFGLLRIRGPGRRTAALDRRRQGRRRQGRRWSVSPRENILARRGRPAKRGSPERRFLYGHAAGQR